MKDAELEVAWVLLQGRNASTELPVRVRSSDMAPGCWKPVRRRLVVDLHGQAWPRTCWLGTLVSRLLGFLYQACARNSGKLARIVEAAAPHSHKRPEPGVPCLHFGLVAPPMRPPGQRPSLQASVCSQDGLSRSHQPSYLSSMLFYSKAAVLMLL